MASTSPPLRPLEPLVCHCNGVTRGEVMASIASGHTSVQSIATDTAAGSSCGSCRNGIRKLLRRETGAPRETIEAVCPCTELDHESLREAVRSGKHGSVDEVLSDLAFTNPDGCARCRPAINYYLRAHGPRDYEVDQHSVLANERTHANIQRDGSYSVVPRIFGGVITAEQLRAIADVAERFDIGMVKLTGAQRIDLVGVPGEQLVAVWEALGRVGLVSGHAYARGVRNVKTCVGEEYCRYGVADAVRLGTELEEMLWGSWTPHKFKLAISACSRNCAEATIKDLGIVAVERGMDIYVGGTAGMRVRAGRRIARVTGERDLLEYVGAFLQLYREEGHYGERSGVFVERVGIDYVRERVDRDPQGRSLLFRDFYRSQHGRQQDPWQTQARTEAMRLVPIRRLVRSAP